MTARATKRRYQFPDGSNYPIIEERRSGLTLLVTEKDVETAERHDPANCALARCAERMGASKAFIAGTVAYVVMKRDGGEVAVKYSVPERSQKAIKTFDETGEMPAEGFTLIPCIHSATSAEKKKRNARRTPEQRTWTHKTGGNRENLRTYRSLTGHVHTIPDEG